MSKFFEIVILILVGGCLAALGGDLPSASKGSKDDVSGEAIWRDAVGLYTQESSDYVDTLSETQQELRYWRQKLLSDRFDERISRLETVLSKSNNEVLNELDGFVSKYGVDGLDDSLMMRLAQLHYDRANFDMTDKMRKYENDLNRYQAGALKEAPMLPAPDYAKTIFYTSQLLHKFPSSPLSDRAHYLLAYCLYDEGKSDKAAKVYDRLLRLHPFSELASEARWRVAEYYFDDGKYEEALKNYKALAQGKSAFALKALYKEGAALYERQSYEEASKVFFELLKKSQARLGGTDPEAETLYDESIDYLAHLRAKKIKFDLDEDTDSLVTEKLSSAYSRIHDDEDARNTYLHYVAAHPLSKWSPKFMNMVIEGYAEEGELAKAQSVRNNFVKALGPSSPYWEKHKDDVGLTLEYQDLYESHVLASAEFYADQARRTKRPVDYEAAIQFYRKFIVEYPTSPLRTQAMFELGELQYFAGKYADASKSYLEVVKAADASDYLDEAAYGYLLAEVKRVNFPLQQSEVAKPDRDPAGALRPDSKLNDGEKTFLKAAQVYVTAVDHGSRRQNVLFRVAEVFFKHNNFDKTREALEMILKDKNASSMTSNAVRLIAVTYDLQGNWEKVMETNRRLMNSAPSADVMATEDDSANKFLSPALNAVWHAEKSGQAGAAASQYEQYSISYSQAPDAAFALYHAGLLYREVGDIAASQRMLNRLTKDFADSDYVPQAEFLKAANAQSLIDFDRAAKAYEDFGKKYASNSLATQAYLNAATIRSGMLLYEKAAADFEEYNKHVGDDEVAFQIAGLYLKAGKKDLALKVLAPFISGRYGRDMFVRALFERAMMSQNVDATDRQTLHAQEDCLAVEAAGARYAKTLAAKALQAVAGCAYVKTFSARNELLRAKPDDADLEKKWEDLQRLYARVAATKNPEWTFRAVGDAGVVAESVRAKLQEKDAEKAKQFGEKALVYFKKTIELKDQTVAREIPQNVLEVMRHSVPELVAFDDALSFWAGVSEDARGISVFWPPDSAIVRGFFDQRKWDNVVQEAAQELKENAKPYLYQAKARAEGELGRWRDARNDLSVCVEKMQNENCAADLLMTGYTGPKMEAAKAIVEKALKSENHAHWKLALAESNARKGHTKDALALATSAVADEPQFAPTYSFIAKLLVEAGRPELARIALDDGYRNSDNDTVLEIQRGHLALGLHQDQQAAAAADDLKDQRTPAASVFLARSLWSAGKKNEAMDALSSPASPQEKDEFAVAQFYLALADKDTGRAEKNLKTVLAAADNRAAAAGLAGLYYFVEKHDAAKANASIALARENGAWGRWLDVQSPGAASLNVRQPADNKEKTP